MKFAICNETYGDWPFDKAFAHARAAGYTGVEIAPFTIQPNVRDISATQRESIRRVAEKNELEIVGLHWLLAKTEGLHLTHDDEAVRKRTAEYLCRLAELTADLGGKIMVFGSPQQRNLAAGVDLETGNQRAVQVFQSIAPVLEKCNVVLALEPLGPEEGNFLRTATEAISLAKMIASPQIKLHLDVKAMSTEPRSIPDIIRDSREWVVHFHANDPNRQGPGMGDVDFVPIAAALNEIGYQGWVSVEVFDYSPGIEALTCQSLDYLNRVWKTQDQRKANSTPTT